MEQVIEYFPIRGLARDGVEVGEVQFREAELLAKSAGDFERFAGRREATDDGAVLLPPPADAADNNTALQIDDWNNAGHG
jgi:hypothetical protein